MNLILEIRSHHDDEQPAHYIVKKFPLAVGRGFYNDIILTDPHVSPGHLSIGKDGKNWLVSDLESANGIFINGVKKRGAEIPVKSGDVVVIGQTELRFYAPDHAVADTVRIQKSNPVLQWLSKPLNAWGCFVLTVSLMQGWAYLEIWTQEIGLEQAITALATIGAVLLWATLWSVAGRLARHKSYFRSHMAVASLYLIAGIIGWYIESYVDFLSNENWLSQIVSYTLHFILFASLVYGGLALATRTAEKKRLISSAAVAFGVIGGIFLISYISAASFNQQPLYPSRLEPYLSWAAPVDGIDSYMNENEKLFSLKEFEQKKIKGG